MKAGWNKFLVLA